MLKENAAKKKLASGIPVMSCFMGCTDPAMAELLAICGVDIVILDNEHNAFSDGQIMSAAHAAMAAGAACMLRTPIHEAEVLSRYMHLGIGGIVATQVHNLKHAKSIVDAVKYPPLGKRGFGNSRSVGFGYSGMSRAEQMQYSNDNSMIFAVLEDMEGIRDAVAIAELDGVDCVDVGFVDLSISMGCGPEPGHPKVKEVIAETVGKIHAAGCASGSFATTPEMVGELVNQGVQIITIGFDQEIIGGVVRILRAALDASI